MFKNSLVAVFGVAVGLAILFGLVYGGIALYNHFTWDDPKPGMEITVYHPEGQVVDWEDRGRCWLAPKSRVSIQAIEDDLVLVEAVQPKTSHWPDLTKLPLDLVRRLSPGQKKLSPCPEKFQGVMEEWEVSYIIRRQKRAKEKQDKIERLKRQAEQPARPVQPERGGR
jgi:hypothetical protein